MSGANSDKVPFHVGISGVAVERCRAATGGAKGEDLSKHDMRSCCATIDAQPVWGYYEKRDGTKERRATHCVAYQAPKCPSVSPV